MLFRVLGPLEVETAGGSTVPPGAGPRALLTALLLQPNTVIPAHRLAEAIWDGDPPDEYVNALHQIVARARRSLGEVRHTLVTRSPGYLLVVGEKSIDAARFEAQYRAARTIMITEPWAAAVQLDEALGLGRGPAYGEFGEGFARPAATRLEELRLAALEDRVELLLACGSPAEAAASARDLIARVPLRERPVGVLMRALYADGRAGEALEAFRRHRELVASELGLDPTPACGIWKQGFCGTNSMCPPGPANLPGSRGGRRVLRSPRRVPCRGGPRRCSVATWSCSCWERRWPRDVW